MAREAVCVLVAPKLAAWTIKPHEFVGIPFFICHLTQRLRKLNVVLNPESGGPRVVDCDMINEVH
jgi:hypothetical protein